MLNWVFVKPFSLLLHLINMTVLFTSLFLVLYFVLIIIYFKIADQYNIIDKPNERSSHKGIVIRGAGIIFPIAFILPVILLNQWSEIYLISIGLILISTISFLDDVLTLNNKVRLSIHFIAVALLMIQLNVFNNYWYVIPFTFIVTVGVINAYNFMDGINGITALYSFVGIFSFYLLRNEFNLYLSEEIYISILASILVFSFFNIRKKAKCFSGDVGSISIAFLLSFLVLSMILQTGQLKWLLFLGIYGLDSVATIVLRIIRKENIFKAHRSHFYQFLVNDYKYNHVYVAILFAISQVLLNYIVYTRSTTSVFQFYFLIVVIYVVTRLRLEGVQRLFVKY